MVTAIGSGVVVLSVLCALGALTGGARGGACEGPGDAARAGRPEPPPRRTWASVYVALDGHPSPLASDPDEAAAYIYSLDGRGETGAGRARDAGAA